MTTTTTTTTIRGTLARQLAPMATTPDLSRAAVLAARDKWAQYRCTVHGFALSRVPMLSAPAGNLKLEKSAAYGLALAPHRTAGLNSCPWSTATCRAGCVAFGGNGRYASVTRARISKTQFAAAHPVAFATILGGEILRLPRNAAVRMNTFSDVPWETIAPWLFTLRPDVTFYDYTKGAARVLADLPANYHLALSASERTTEDDIRGAITRGVNVAVVFNLKRTATLPETYLGAPVIDADKSDRWIIDNAGRGVVGGLRVKGLMVGHGGAMVREVTR